MRFNDFLNPKTGPEALVRLALVPLFILACGGLAMALVAQLKPAAMLAAMVLLMLISPVAYALRERRPSRRQQPRPRRGAERAPVLPPEEEE